MAKITLNDITSGYLSASALNSRMQQIEDELNNKVLYRDNPVGETNTMLNLLDMNSHKIINLTAGTNPNDAITLSQLQNYLASATATQIVFTPAGNISSANVQLAIQELDTEKAPVSHTHTKSQITDFAHTHVIADITDAGTLASLNSVNTPQINNNAVTFAKMQHIANNTFLGRHSGGSGEVEAMTVTDAKTLLNLTGTNSGDQTITLTGDVTGSGTGSFAATIANSAVTLAKMANMATASLLGRNTAGTGAPEVLSTATVKTMLDLTGTNSGDQTITLTGDVTGSGTGSFAATIANDAVTFAKLQNISTATFLGRNTAGTGDTEQLSIATAKTMLNLTGTNSGDQTITLTGDVTGSGTGSFAATIPNDTVTFAKMQNIATASFLGRNTAGSGDTEELSVATAKTMLNLTGTNSGDQTITLTGDVTGSGTGSFAATIANDTVTFAKMQNITSMRILGRTTASSGDIEEIDIASLTQKSTPAGTERILADDAGTLKYILASALTGGGGGGSGEVNTASNVGTGNGWFKQKNGVDLEFYTFAVANGLSASLATNVWTLGISDGGITYAKIQNVSATDKLLGRSTAGAGTIEEITCTSAGRALIDDVDAAAQRTTLGLGTLATLSSVTATELANDAVTFAKMQNITTDRLLGRDTAATGDPEELTVGGGIEFTGTGGIQTSAFTGDVTKTAGGTATTIANDAVTTAKIINDAVTYAKIQNVSATNRLLGRYTAAAGDIEEATLGADHEFSAGALRLVAFTGDVTKTAGGTATTIATDAVTTTKILNSAVTYAKLQNVSATNRLLGRYTAGAGVVEEATLGADLEFSTGALRVGAFTGDVTKTAGSLATTVLSASTTQAGKVELATTAETDTGTATTLAITPDGLLNSKWTIQSFIIACSDLTTALTAGTNKAYFRMPYAFTVTAVRASLFTAQTSGNIFTVDINESGTSIISTKLTIDNTEKTSTTAATAAVISDTALADDAEITIDIDQIGDGTAKGLVVEIIGRRA